MRQCVKSRTLRAKLAILPWLREGLGTIMRKSKYSFPHRSQENGRLPFKRNNLHSVKMKLSQTLRVLATALQSPNISRKGSAMLLAKPTVGRTQLTSQIAPFSTHAKLQARDSKTKRPRKDPRISSSPLDLFLFTRLSVYPRSSDTLPSLPSSNSSAPPLLASALPSSLDHSPRRPNSHAS